MNVNLSKSNFIKGVQCPKMLWLAEYAPDERTELDNSLIFKNGHRVGDLAKDYFGEYVEVELDRENKPGMIAETERFLEEGYMNICEASFGYDGLFCMVDILHRNEDGSFDMIEVKSATKLKTIFKYDIAFQYYVLTHSGINVRNAYCMYINKVFERKGDIDKEEFFILEDCTGYATEMQPEVEERIHLINDIMKSDIEPDIVAGPQCDDPYECEFKRHCGAAECGCMDIREAVPEDEDAAVNFAESLSYPVCCLWIDLCGWPIPPYGGIRPYKQTAFHYSLSIQYDKDGETEFCDFLPDVTAGEETDPRRPLAEALCRDIPDGAVIVTCRRGMELYDRNIESRLIKNLAYANWDLKERLLDISGRCLDIADAFGSEYCLRPVQAEGIQEAEASYLYLHEKTEERIAEIREIIQEQGKANILSIADAMDRVRDCLR